MKVYMKQIKMIAWFTEHGKLTPLKFQIQGSDNELVTIRVDNIIQRGEEKLAGNRMIVYRCQSEIDGVEKVYELKYEVGTCKWYLYKM
jgi:hypothetical protein